MAHQGPPIAHPCAASEPNDRHEDTGTKIGMSFSFGHLCSQYGEATCDGIVPLLLPENKFPNPGIVRDPDLMPELLAKLVPEYRDLWPTLLDEDVEARLKDYIIMASFISPTLELSNPRHLAFITLTTFAVTIDDIVDDADFAGSLNYQDGKNVSRFFRDLFTGKYNSRDEQANPSAALNIINDHAWALYEACRAGIPFFHERSEPFIRSVEKLMDAHVLLMESNGFSSSSKAHFRAICSGGDGAAEFLALMFGFEIPEQVRQDLLFERLKWYISAAADLTNDIFGLVRDVRLELAKDSSILSAVVQGGLDLQKAFDNTLEELCEHMNDMRIVVATLRELYATHEGVQQFLRMAEMMVDGHMRVYTGMERYKIANLLRIVAMPDDK